MNSKFSEQMRKAILESELSRYEICKRVGLAESSMSKFIAGQRGLSMQTIDDICALLNLKIVSTGKGKGKNQ